MANDIQGLDAVNAAIRNLRRASIDAAANAMKRCGRLAMMEAKRNAPKSPTMKQRSATLKRRKRTKASALPGGLERSIQYESGDLGASIFVASNSEAKAYAKRIHDEKGVTWRNRGPGTVHKGPRADEKFIERAIKDNVQDFGRIIDNELDKALKKAWR